MPILPLPQFESDLKQLQEEDRKVYEALKAPRSIVVRYGVMKLVGEFPYAGVEKPGCGSKLVVKTTRGTELGEMLTSTCTNSGCSKSVSRKEMLQYIDNSGGRDYPFTTEGRILRIADTQDMEKFKQVEQSRHGLRLEAKAIAERLGMGIKVVEAEPVLGGETLTFYYLSENRIELTDLLNELRSHFRNHVELRHVGARDEARITADYERCGQYCCCKNFLKVLKPVSMKSAKTQKATLDPLKISGRCGRLMCCLRYEDQTYEDLKKNLPRKKSRVGTPEGDGTVIDGQILTQLVLVLLDAPGSDGKSVQVAVPIEHLTPPINALVPPPPPMPAARGTIARPPLRPTPQQPPASPSARLPRPDGPQENGPKDLGGASQRDPSTDTRAPQDKRGGDRPSTQGEIRPREQRGGRDGPRDGRDAGPRERPLPQQGGQSQSEQPGQSQRGTERPQPRTDGGSGESQGQGRDGGRNDQRNDPRNDPRNDQRNDQRNDPRGDSRSDPQSDRARPQGDDRRGDSGPEPRRDDQRSQRPPAQGPSRDSQGLDSVARDSRSQDRPRSQGSPRGQDQRPNQSSNRSPDRGPPRDQRQEDVGGTGPGSAPSREPTVGGDRGETGNASGSRDDGGRPPMQPNQPGPFARRGRRGPSQRPEDRGNDGNRRGGLPPDAPGNPPASDSPPANG